MKYLPLCFVLLSFFLCPDVRCGEREGGGGDTRVEQFIADANGLKLLLLEIASQSSDPRAKEIAEIYANDFGELLNNDELEVLFVDILKPESGGVSDVPDPSTDPAWSFKNVVQLKSCFKRRDSTEPCWEVLTILPGYPMRVFHELDRALGLFHDDGHKISRDLLHLDKLKLKRGDPDHEFKYNLQKAFYSPSLIDEFRADSEALKEQLIDLSLHHGDPKARAAAHEYAVDLGYLLDSDNLTVSVAELLVDHAGVIVPDQEAKYAWGYKGHVQLKLSPSSPLLSPVSWQAVSKTPGHFARVFHELDRALGYNRDNSFAISIGLLNLH